MDTMELQAKLKTLAQLRNELQYLNAQVQNAQMSIQLSPAWTHLTATQEARDDTSKKVSELEQEVRNNALILYAEIGEKKLVEGIQIKEFSIVNVVDESLAVRWASQNALFTLQLNQTKFKKAVEGLDLPFMSKKAEFRPQIASDLSKYLNS